MSEQLEILGEMVTWSLRTFDMSEVRVVIVLRLQGTMNLEFLRAVSSVMECYFYFAAELRREMPESYSLTSS